MWDWLLVYLVVFFFVFLFQRMITFFDPKENKSDKPRKEEEDNSLD